MKLFDRDDLKIFGLATLALMLGTTFSHLQPRPPVEPEPPRYRTGATLETYQPPPAVVAPPPQAAVDLEHFFQLRDEIRAVQRQVAQLEQPQAVVEGVTAEDIARAVWDSDEAGDLIGSTGTTTAYFAADAITASAIATDAISASELATSVLTAVGLASSNLDAQLDVIDTCSEAVCYTTSGQF